MDALDVLIKIASPEIRLEAYHTFQYEFSATHKRKANTCCSLIFALEGECGVLMPDEDDVWLSKGDFLLINNNDGFRIVSKASEILDSPAYGAVGLEEIEMMKSRLGCNAKILYASVANPSGAASTFFKLLPDRLFLPASAVPVQSPFVRMVKMILSEIGEGGGGSRPITESFVNRALVLAFKEMILLNFSRCGILSLCAHPTLNRFVCSVIEDPSRGWSLDWSVGTYLDFSEREIIEVSGFASATILTLIRILTSFPLLTTSKKTILQIGVMVGYGSAAEYSRVFKEWVGGSPESFRLSRANSYFP